MVCQPKPRLRGVICLEPTTGLEPVNLFLTKEVLYLLSYVGLISMGLYGPPYLCGGEGRIRTSEGVAGRFTVCSLWPLGNLTIIFKSKSHRRNRTALVKAVTPCDRQ